jgi:Zn-dependent protease
VGTIRDIFLDQMDSFESGLQRLSVQFVPFLFAVVIHEFGHGYVAKRFGDNTAEEAGRLTLNPVPHIDILGTLIFPIINMVSGMSVMFGWAKPVPIDPRRFSSARKGLFFVSFAGPAFNFMASLLSAVGLLLWVRLVSKENYLFEPITLMLNISVIINFGLGFFNLIPIPPLDGSKMLESFLPTHLAIRYERLSKYGFAILLLLLFSGAIRYIAIPVYLASEATLHLASLITGISLENLSAL